MKKIALCLSVVLLIILLGGCVSVPAIPEKKVSEFKFKKKDIDLGDDMIGVCIPVILKINSDEYPDLIVLDKETGRLKLIVRDNSPDSKYLSSGLLVIENKGAAAKEILVADINFDGIEDFVTGFYTNEIKRFIARIEDNKLSYDYSTITQNDIKNGYPILIADYTADGTKDDIIFIRTPLDEESPIHFVIFYGDGSGGINRSSRHACNVQPFIFDAAIGDVDYDGLPDVILAYFGAIAIFLGNKVVEEGQVLTIDFPNDYISTITASDVNGDNIPDLIFYLMMERSIGIIFGGQGSLGKFLRLPFHLTFSNNIDLEVHDIQVVDMNGDGNPDLITAADNTTGEKGDYLSVAIISGIGNGEFDMTNVFFDMTEGTNCSLCVEDMNSDGKPDLVVTSFLNGKPKLTLLQQVD